MGLLRVVILLCPVAKGKLEVLSEQRCTLERQGSLTNKKQRKIEVQSRAQVLGRFQRATTRLEAKGFQRRMDSRHRQLLPLKGKKDSLKQQWTEQRRSFYGYCSSKLHRSQDRHGLETKKRFSH